PDDPWPVVGYPAFHLLVVALAGVLLRLLAGPVHAALQDLAYVFGVEADAEVAADQSGHAPSSPQVIGPAVGNSPLPEQRFQGGPLFVPQTWPAAKGGLGGQAVRPASQTPPARQGAGSDAQDTSDHAGAFSRIQQLDRAPATPFQFRCAAFGPHTFILCT